MCACPASCLLWCARLSERGVVQHWGSKSWQWHVRASVSGGVGVDPSVAVAAVAVGQWHLHLHLHIHHQMYMHVHMYVRKYLCKYASQACICKQIRSPSLYLRAKTANTPELFFVFTLVFNTRLLA
jgi:hypothetical protein